MKKLMVLLLVGAMVLSLAGCSTTPTVTDPDRGNIQDAEAGKKPGKFPKETQSNEKTTLPVEPSKEKNPINNQTKDSDLLIKAIWSSLSGLWTDKEGNVIYFANDNDQFTFLSGTASQSYPYRRDPGTPSKASMDQSGIVSMTITYPPVKGDAADSLDLQSVTETLQIDLANFNTNDKVKIRQVRVKAPGTTWELYTKSTGTYGNTDPYIPETPEDPANQTTEAPAVELTIPALWDMLGGCWIGPDEHFAYFTYADGVPAYLTGLWDAPEPVNRGSGIVNLLLDRGDDQYSVDMTYPPIEGATDRFGANTYDAVVHIDLSRLEQDHVLLILGSNEQWLPYVWGGASYDDAYDAAHDTNPWMTFDHAQDIWLKMMGSWGCAEGEVITFEQMDSSTLLFEHHPVGTQAGRYGTLDRILEGTTETTLCCQIYYPAEGDQPEVYEYVLIDIYDLATIGIPAVQIGEEGELCLYAKIQ